MDYSSVDAIARTLSRNQIHTVISTLSGLTTDVAEAELRLIRGAAASTTVKRFAPSEFGFDYDQDDEYVKSIRPPSTPTLSGRDTDANEDISHWHGSMRDDVQSQSSSNIPNWNIHSFSLGFSWITSDCHKFRLTCHQKLAS